MKTNILISIFIPLLISFRTEAQNIELTKSKQSGKWEHSEIIENKGSRADLYYKFMDWVAKSIIPNQNKGILSSSEEDLKATIQISGSPAPINPLRPLMHTEMGYKISVKFKDERFKIIFSDFNYSYVGGASIVVDPKNEPFESFKPKKQQKLVAKANENINSTLANLKDFLSGKLENKEEDW